MIAIIDQLSILSPETALSAAFRAGITASLSLYGVIRLPIVAGYVAGAGKSRIHATLLAILFALGFITGTTFLGLTAIPTDDGQHSVLHVNGAVYQVLGLGLFAIGILISGLVHPELFPEKLRRTAQRLSGAALPGAFLLGGAFGLLQTWVHPYGGAGLLSFMEATAAAGASQGSLVLLVSFAVGQSATALAAGVLTALVKPDLLLSLRRWMCSLEQRIQLLAGNLLMVLGIYLVIIG